MLPFYLTFASRKSFYVFVTCELCRIEITKFFSIFLLIRRSRKLRSIEKSLYKISRETTSENGIVIPQSLRSSREFGD